MESSTTAAAAAAAAAAEGPAPPQLPDARHSSASVSSSAASTGSACSCGTARRGQRVLFRWTQDADSVSVVGSWNGWGKPLPLEGTTDAFGRGHLFSRIIELPPGRHQFKFIVDGQWKYDPHCQFEADAYNVLNNVVCVEPRSEGAGGGGSSLLVEPHKRSKSGSSWMSMPGEQARHKWERASAAMQRLAITRTDSQETVILALTPHERQQVANSLREFGLGPRSGSAAAAVAAAAAATATATATAGHNGSAIHAEEKEGGLPPQQQQHVALPADGAEPALANGGGRQRPHAPGQHRRGRSTMASLGGSSASGSGSGSGVSSGASLASSAHVDDDMHMHMHIPPSLLKALTSKRGSQLHLASLLGEGSDLPPGRSRSMTDLDRMQQAGGHGGHGGGGGSPLLATLRDTGSGLYALSSGGAAAAAAAEGEAAVQQQPPPPDACAAVGSCAVKSTSTVLREGKLILAMVGLPGRGKTHIARALRRHLEWMGLRVGYFNSSEYRRQALGEKVSPDFFDPTDAEAWQVRREIAGKALQDVVAALRTDIDIAVFDAANCTRAWRRWIRQQVQEAGLYAQTIFIEAQCESGELIASNIHQTILRSPEYRDMSEAEATADFERKNAHYLAIYETVQEDEDFSFLKVVDGNRKIVAHRINGYIPGRIMLLLANIHTKPRPIWFSRHGESQFNAMGRIGGDSPLSPRGMLYAQKLNDFISSVYPRSDPANPAAPDQPLTVWTSTMVRTGMTVEELNKSYEVVKWRCLSEIEAGSCDGLTYQQVLEQFPDEYRKRKDDKYNYRYPRGESYQDVFLRLEPVIFEMLRTTTPLLIVGHQAILRIIYGYLMGRRPEDCPELAMPLHTVIQLTPLPYGCEEVWHSPMAGMPGEEPEHGPGGKPHSHEHVHPRNQGGDV